MGTYHADQRWRRTVTLLVRLIALVVFLAAVIGLGWAVLDYMISNPLPYHDPEARQAVTWPRHGGRQSGLPLQISPTPGTESATPRSGYGGARLVL